MSISERLKQLRLETGLSQTSFAEILGLAQTTYGPYETGKRGVPDELKSELSRKYNINIHWLVTGQGSMHLDGSVPEEAGRALAPEEDRYNISVPMTSLKVSAGTGQEWLAGDLTGEMISIPKRVSRRYPNNSRFAAAEVVGDSMEPTLHSGEPVVFVKDHIEGDGIYVLSVRGELFVKRLEFNRVLNRIRIISDNVKYPVTEVNPDNGDVSILGKVVIWVHGEV
ncbi:MAG: XRE family transcriptional regulator [Sphaerochaetaceae bacterium]